MADGHEYALYAASRSIALPLAVIYGHGIAFTRGRSDACCSRAMVQLFDGILGLRLIAFPS